MPFSIPSANATSTSERFKHWRLRIFSLTWIAYIGFYLTRKAFPLLKVQLETDPDFMMTKMQMGYIDAGFGIAYAIGQFTCGMLGDRFGARKVLLTGMLFSLLIGIAMGMSNTVVLIGAFFTLQGLVQASGWAPLAKNVNSFFSIKERGRMMGWWCTNYAIGGGVATLFAGFCADLFSSWRFGFFGPSVALFIIWGLLFLFQKNRPEDAGLPSIEKHQGEPESVLQGAETAKAGSWLAIRAVVFQKMVLYLGAVYFFLKPTRYAMFFWGPLLIKESLGVSSLAEIGFIYMFFPFSGPLATLAGGYISDKVFNGKRMPISILCLFTAAIILFFFHDIAQMKNPIILAAGFFALGFAAYIPDSLISGTAAVDFGTNKGASTATGFINGCGSIGAILGMAAPGFIVEQWGWNAVFVSLSLMVLTGAFILLPNWNALPKKQSVS